VQYINNDAPGSTPWSVWLKQQMHEGITVLNTRIRIYLYASGVYRIEGHWFSEMHVPASDTYSENDGRELLYGYNIEGFAGAGSTYVVTETSFTDTGSKVVLPVVIGRKTELRVAWEHEIEYPGISTLIPAVVKY
jgi:hypothetical protein